MATRTIAPGGGDWSVPGTWVEGAVPTAADDVVATGASGQLTVTTAAACRSMDLTGYTNTLTLVPTNALPTNQLVIGTTTLPPGSVALKFPTGMKLACSIPALVTGFAASVGSILFSSTAVGVQTVDFNCNNVGRVGNVTFDGVGASWQLLSTLNTGWYSAVLLNNGTLDFNSQTCDFGRFSSSNSNIRTLTLGAATIDLHSVDSSGPDTWGTRTTTNLTVTANTANITLWQEMSAGNNLWASAGINWNGMSVTMRGGPGALHTTTGGTSTFFNFSVLDVMIFPYKPWLTTTRWQCNSPVTVTNKLTLKGYDSGRRLRVMSNSGTSLRTMGVTGATVDVDFVDFEAIGFNVAQSFITKTVGDEGANSSITFPTGQTNFFYAPGTGDKRWSYPGYWFLGTGGTGGAGRCPLPQDIARFDSASFTMAGCRVIGDTPRFGEIDWTGVTNSPVWHLQRLHVSYGNVTLDAGMSITSTKNASFTLQRLVAGGTYTIKSNGVSWPLYQGGFVLGNTVAGVTIKLLDDLVVQGAITAAGDTVDLNNKNVSCASFNNSSGAGGLLMGSSTITLTGIGTVWSSGGGVTAGTSLIKLTDTLATTIINSPMFTKTFAGNGRTYNNIEFAGTGRGRYTITGSNTFNDFKISKTVPTLMQFTNGTTQTVTTFTVTGTANKYISLFSTSNAASYTLTKAGGGVIVGDYWIVSRGTFTPAATWSATNSVDCGNTSGIAGLGDGPITWTGAVNSNFSVGGNWTGGVAPGVSDIAFFLGSGNVACTMDTAVNVAGVQISSTYTAIITQAATLVVGDLEWSQLNGTFTGATQTIDFNGCFYKNGGTYTDSSGTVTFSSSVPICIRTDTSFSSSGPVIIGGTGFVLLLTAVTFTGATRDVTINAGARFNLNGLLLTVGRNLIVNGTIRSTGTDLAVTGTITFSPTTSTLELGGTNTITLETFFTTTTFFNLVLNASKQLGMTGGGTYTINGDITPGFADRISGQGTGQRGQCTLRSTLPGYMWKLNLVGVSTVGPATDISDCDARPGKWFEAIGSTFLDTNQCKLSGNYRCIEKPRKAGRIFRSQNNF